MNDPGAQPERTRLAWRRTILSATILVILAIRFLVHDRVPHFPMLGVITLGITWLIFVYGANRRANTIARHRVSAMRAPWPAMAALAIVMLVAVSMISLVIKI